jgi:hypothetical protein
MRLASLEKFGVMFAWPTMTSCKLRRNVRVQLIRARTLLVEQFKFLSQSSVDLFPFDSSFVVARTQYFLYQFYAILISRQT